MTEKLKASLRIVLYAGETEVAESTDGALWQATLAKITGVPSEPEDEPRRDHGQADVKQRRISPAGHDGLLGRWATALDVSEDELVGACSPTLESPFLHLNARNWEKLKENTPTRGSNGVSPMKLAATLLALWQHYAKFDPPTTSTAQLVLKTIQLYDTKAQRGLDATEWLRRSGSNFLLNPGKLSQALALAKAYVSEEPIAQR